MKFHVEKRHILIGLGAVLAPLAGGCGPAAILDLSDTDSRAVFMVNEAPAGQNGGFDDEAVETGVASATISANGTADIKYDTDKVHDMTGLVDQGGGLYTGPTGYAQVMPIADVDQDGTQDDTFLVFTQNNPQSNQRTEYTYAYHGTRAPTDFIDTLRSNDHKAQYTGGGSFRGAIGNDFIDMHGNLTMDVEFGGKTGDIQGRIDNLTNYGATPPVPIDDLTFAGALNDVNSTADFAITDVALNHAGAPLTTADGGIGAGSFFGPRAGGTIGVFTYSGALDAAVVPAKPRVNLMGAFHGSTTDNN